MPGVPDAPRARVPLAVWLLGLLLLAHAVPAWLVHPWRRDLALIAVRQAMFSRIASDSRALSRASSADLPRFLSEPSPDRADRPLLPDTLRARLRVEADPFRRAIQLARYLSAFGGNSCGGPRFDLGDKLAWLRAGNGCCSDHTQVFLAAAQEVQLLARVAGNGLHQGVEVWAGDAGGWQYVDVMLVLSAHATDGAPLSFLALRERLLAHQPVTWVFEGEGARAPRSTDAPLYLATYGRPGQEALVWNEALWVWGNNVREQVRFDARLRLLPLALRQVMGQVVGVRPLYVYLDDPASAPEVRLVRLVRIGVIVDATVLLVLAVLSLRALRRRRGTAR